MIIELGVLSVETKGLQPGPIIEPLVGSKIMRIVTVYL